MSLLSTRAAGIMISTSRTRSGKFVIFAESKPHVATSLRPVGSVRPSEIVAELTDEMNDALWCAYAVDWDTLREDPASRQPSSLRRRLLLTPPVPLNRDAATAAPVAYLDPEQHPDGDYAVGDDRSVVAVLGYGPESVGEEAWADVLLCDGTRTKRPLDTLVVDLP